MEISCFETANLAKNYGNEFSLYNSELHEKSRFNKTLCFKHNKTLCLIKTIKKLFIY